MKRIGTTTEGGALIEFSAGEVQTIQTALALLNEIGGDVPQSIAPPALSARAVRPPKSPNGKPTKVAAAPAPCSGGGLWAVFHPDGDDYGLHMRHFVLESEAREKAAEWNRTYPGHEVIPPNKEAGRRIAERDPNLDPPQQHGRTLATGSEPVTFGSN